MIASAILFLIYGAVYVLTSPLRLFADASMPASVLTTIATVNGYLTAFDAIFPLSTLFSVLAAVVSIEALIFAYKAIMWGIKRLPTQS